MPLVTVAAPIKQPRMRFFDADGKPLVGGRVYSYKVGTDLFRPTFRNAYKTALNQNPIILDNAGSALIYLTGSHLLQVFDRFGNFVSMHYLPVTEMRAYFHDKLGKPLKYGRIETYDIASTIKKASYGDSQKESLNTNPVILDKNGSAVICIVGSYRLRVYDEKGVFLWDEDFFREPARALTSRVYPAFCDEYMQSQCEVNTIQQKDAVFNIEDSHLDCTLKSITWRTPLNEYTSEVQNSQSDCEFIGIQVTSQKNDFHIIEIKEQNSQASCDFVGISITREVRYINIYVESQNAESGCNFMGIQIL